MSAAVGLHKFILMTVFFVLRVFCWSDRQRDLLLQQLTFRSFVTNVIGEREKLLYPNLKLFLDVKKLLLPLVGDHQNIS